MMFQLVRIFSLSAVACVLAVAWTPILTHFLYRYRLGKQIRDSKTAPIFSKMHQKKSGTPTMGGVLIWGTVAFLALLIFYIAHFFNLNFFKELNFLSRSQTLLPLGALVAAGLIGLLDDFLNVRKIGSKGGGLKMHHKILIYTLIATIGAWWFYTKLDWSLIHIPFVGDFEIGLWYIPLFIFILSATSFSVNEVDGLDGLAGGILLIIFAAFGVIAFVQGRFDLACLCGVIVGTLVSFLWFNIYPARFFMGDTGSMALGVALGVIAMLTNSFILLPIIGFILVIESLSVIVQITSKKIRKKKIFLSTPIHHHFEAIGWPEPKIVMRFWLINGILAIFGLIIFFAERIS